MSVFASLLPHAGTAVMLEDLIRWDEKEILARSNTHRSATNPLRHSGRLSSIHLAEFGAQAMAAHGALRAQAAGARPASALLVAIRQFEATLSYVEDLAGSLDILARELLAEPAGWQYEFEVSHEGQRIARGRVAALVFPLPGFQAAGNSN